MEEAPEGGTVLYEYLEDCVGETEISGVDDAAWVYFKEGVGGCGDVRRANGCGRTGTVGGAGMEKPMMAEVGRELGLEESEWKREAHEGLGVAKGTHLCSESGEVVGTVHARAERVHFLCHNDATRRRFFDCVASIDDPLRPRQTPRRLWPRTSRSLGHGLLERRKTTSSGCTAKKSACCSCKAIPAARPLTRWKSTVREQLGGAPRVNAEHSGRLSVYSACRLRGSRSPGGGEHRGTLRLEQSAYR